MTVRESRGRFSYLTPDRAKPITARRLGDDFDKAAVCAVLEQNARRAAEKPAPIPEYPGSIKERLQRAKMLKTDTKRDSVERMVDIEAKRAEGKGKGYEQWAKVFNLKQIAKTMVYLEEQGFSSPQELEEAVTTAYSQAQESGEKLKAVESALQEKKELQRQVLAYAKTKPARDGLRAQKTEKARAAYRSAHESDFIIADAAVRYFKARGITKLPARKSLQGEIESLTAEKNALYNDYREKKQRAWELFTVQRNIEQVLRSAPGRQKTQGHELE